MSRRAAVALAVVTAAVAGAALTRELTGGAPGALRPGAAALAVLAAGASLRAARHERGAPAWVLVALGVTLGLCAVVLLA